MSPNSEKAEKLAYYIYSLMDIVIRNQCNCLNDISSELSLQELRTIKFIGDCKHCIMREISDHLMIAVSTLTAIVDKMVRKKFVNRYRDENDRRIVRVELTEKGKEIYNLDREHHVHLSKEMLKHLKSYDQDVLLNLLATINLNYQNSISAK